MQEEEKNAVTPTEAAETPEQPSAALRKNRQKDLRLRMRGNSGRRYRRDLRDSAGGGSC